MGRIVKLFVVVIACVVFFQILKDRGPKIEGNPPPAVKAVKVEPKSTLDKSPEKQAERRKLIDDLVQKRVFAKVTFDGTPEIWAGPAWAALDFATKESFASVVYAYGTDDKYADSVRLRDNFSGKEIGTYSRVYGGLKME